MKDSSIATQLKNFTILEKLTINKIELLQAEFEKKIKEARAALKYEQDQLSTAQNILNSL